MTFGLCDWLCRAREIKLNDIKVSGNKMFGMARSIINFHCIVDNEVVLLLEALDDASKPASVSSARTGKAVNSKPLSYMATFKFLFVCNIDWVTSFVTRTVI